MAKGFLRQLLELLTQSTQKTQPKPRSVNRTRSKTSGKLYPVGIVGESNYQSAIKRCKVGERVQIIREIGNPYDEEALAVARLSGATIGYLGRDHWLYSAINDEGKGCTAYIKSIAGKPLGVVIEVELTGRQLGLRDYIS